MIPGISWLWVIPPLATGLVLLAHPIIDPWHAAGVAGLAPLVARNDVWLAVHLALLVLFPLSALALLQPVSGMQSATARVARVMLGIFGVLYASFDTFAGLATGVSGLSEDHRFFMSFTLAGLGNFSPFNGALSGAPR